MNKVNIDVIKPWITKRITELLGMEDDVIIDFCFNLLEKNRVRMREGEEKERGESRLIGEGKK